MTQPTPEEIIKLIMRGTSAGRKVAVQRARQTGTPLIVWRDGKVAKVSPDDVSPRKTGKTKGVVAKKGVTKKK